MDYPEYIETQKRKLKERLLKEAREKEQLQKVTRAELMTFYLDLYNNLS